MNADRLLGDLDEILTWADENLHPRAAKRRYGAPRGGRGSYFMKAAGDSDAEDDGDEPNPHAKTKAEHHEKLAELYKEIADRHTAMSDHYSTGAKGAHRADAGEADEPSKDDAEDEAE